MLSLMSSARIADVGLTTTAVTKIYPSAVNSFFAGIMSRFFKIRACAIIKYPLWLDRSLSGKTKKSANSWLFN